LFVRRVVPSGDHWADLKKLCAVWSDGAVEATQRGVIADESCPDIAEVVISLQRLSYHCDAATVVVVVVVVDVLWSELRILIVDLLRNIWMLCFIFV